MSSGSDPESRPTLDLRGHDRAKAQLQMERTFLRVQRSLFGNEQQRTIAHYTIVRPVGQGAMGVVYEAIDQRLDRKVALKLVLPELLESARSKPRLLREARAMAQIAHPNVVAVHDVGESSGVVFIAMEFVRGETVRQWNNAAARTLPEILDVFIQAGAGLAAAHRARIVHRDFKPDNVLIGEDGRARVVDFGLAFPRLEEIRAAHRGDTPVPWGLVDATSSADDTIAGTIAYMSPEQLQARTVDARSDQFSFCVALYEALYGQLPFGGASLDDFVASVVHGARITVDAAPEIPSWLVSVLDRGLSGEREERFRSMSALTSILAAGRAMLSQSATPLASETRDRILDELGGTVEWQMATSPLGTFVGVRSSTDAPRIALAAHDPRAPQIREVFASLMDRASHDHMPPALRPAAMLDEPACLALVFADDAPYVAISGMVRANATRDVVLALEIARSLTRTTHALGHLALAIDPAAATTLLLDVRSFEIGPIDPTWILTDQSDALERYRIVGALLFALLATDVAEQHRPASGLHDQRQVPACVGELIDKLLNRDDTYRSARGILDDIDRCLEACRRGSWTDIFELGTQDIDGRFIVSDQLRGREHELEGFEALARDVGTTTSGLVLITGASGIGKTALLDELGRQLGKGSLAHGKFDQYANNEPYATIVQALRGLIRRFVEDGAASREKWRERILHAVAPNAELLFSMIPEIHGLIGDQPITATAPPMESAVRFGETLKRLLTAFASELSPLLIVLDDVQWCDSASVRLIASMLADVDVGDMIWICAYRDNEISSRHPMRELIDLASTPSTRVQRLHLTPLSVEDLSEFLAATLGCDPERAAALSTFFRDKTDGNPLFARTLLTALYEQGLFRFSSLHENWSWDDDAIRSAALPDSIQELVERKFQALSVTARQLLGLASCIGRDVEPSLVMDVLGQRGVPRTDVDAAIRECLDRGMLATTSVHVSSEGPAANVLNFTHDRVQQTAHAFLEPELRDRLRLEAGLALLERVTPQQLAERLFRIVGYLNAGARYASEAVKARIVELDIVATQRALVANAFVDAVWLLEDAIALLPDDRWATQYDQTVELYLKYLHALALLGRRNDEDTVFDLLRSRVHTDIHVARLYELKVMLESSRGEHHAAIERGVAGLRLLGEKLPGSPGQFEAASELARTWGALRTFDPDHIDDLPAASSEHAGTSRLLVAVSAPAYLANSNLFAIVMMRLVRRSLRYGMSEASSHGFAGFGLIVSGLLGQHERARRYAVVAHRLDERFSNLWLQPRVDLMSGIFIQPWTRPFEECEAILSRGARIAVANADFVYASYTETSRVCAMYYRGETLENVLNAGAQALRHTNRASDPDMEAVVTAVVQVCRCLRGETSELDDFSTPAESDDSFMARLNDRTTPIGVFFCRAIRCSALYLHGYWEKAAALGLAAADFQDKAFSNPSLAEHQFYYAMALLRIWADLSWSDRLRARRVVGRALKRFERWARFCPTNFRSRLELLKAEHARVHDAAVALNHLNAALDSATLDSRAQYEALACELAAEHCDALGQRSVAGIYRGRSIGAYRRWGAIAKAQQLELLPHDSRVTTERRG